MTISFRDQSDTYSSEAGFTTSSSLGVVSLAITILLSLILRVFVDFNTTNFKANATVHTSYPPKSRKLVSMLSQCWTLSFVPTAALALLDKSESASPLRDDHPWCQDVVVAMVNTTFVSFQIILNSLNSKFIIQDHLLPWVAHQVPTALEMEVA